MGPLGTMFADDEARWGAAEPAAFVDILMRRVFHKGEMLEQRTSKLSPKLAKGFRRQLSDGDIFVFDEEQKVTSIGQASTCTTPAQVAPFFHEALLLPQLSVCRKERFRRMIQHPTWAILRTLAVAAANASQSQVCE